MDWELEEALEYYKKQGAPGDQSMLIALLKEIQKEGGGYLSQASLTAVAQAYQIKESFLMAVIKRIPSLRVDLTHVLELCGGPVCSKRAALAAFVEKTYGKNPEGFTWKLSPCMRLCGKGPNIKWDGVMYSGATPEMIRELVEKNT